MDKDKLIFQHMCSEIDKFHSDDKNVEFQKVIRCSLFHGLPACLWSVPVTLSSLSTLMLSKVSEIGQLSLPYMKPCVVQHVSILVCGDQRLSAY